MSGSWWFRKRDCFKRGWGPFCSAFWCPSCAMAEAKHRADDSSCCFNWLCMFSPAIRKDIRMDYELNGSDCEDIFYTCCCPSCAAVQVLNETTERGPIRGRKVTQAYKNVNPSTVSAYGPIPVVGPVQQTMGMPMGMDPHGATMANMAPVSSMAMANMAPVSSVAMANMANMANMAGFAGGSGVMRV